MNGTVLSVVHFDYGCGYREKYPLMKVCLVEVGKGKHLFSPAMCRDMSIDRNALYVVLTLDDGRVEVREVTEDVSMMFAPAM